MRESPRTLRTASRLLRRCGLRLRDLPYPNTRMVEVSFYLSNGGQSLIPTYSPSWTAGCATPGIVIAIFDFMPSRFRPRATRVRSRRWQNFRMCGYRQIWSDDDLPGLVCFYFQPAAGRRGENTRSPQHGSGFNSLLANDNSFGIYTRDAGIGVDLNA